MSVANGNHQRYDDADCEEDGGLTYRETKSSNKETDKLVSSSEESGDEIDIDTLLQRPNAS